MAGETLDRLLTHSLDQDARLRALERSGARLDAYLSDREAERRRIELDDRRNQAQLDQAARADMQVRFDAVYADYGERCRPPASDESPERYRRSILRDLRDRLGEDDRRPVRRGNPTAIADVASLPLKGVTGPALDIVERDIVDATRQQAMKPAYSTLPPAGEFVARDRTDAATGERKIEWHGRESFIRSMSRHGRKVARLVNPKTGQVLIGPPWPGR